jgi:hypothetical protein
MPKLRDGVIKRGGSWSYVIRVPDPATGVTKPKWVAGRLGHADPAVTLRVYSHVLREHAAGVGDIFAQAVKGAR